MKIQQTPYQAHKQQIRKWIIVSFVIFCFIGFVDASYLTASHYIGVPPNCSLFSGCEKVTTSIYSKVFNIPISLIGSIYYLFLIILSILYIDTKDERILPIIIATTGFGFVASVWFVYLQIFVIKAICIYCMISAMTTLILFLLSILMLKYIRNNIRFLSKI